jgi:hypothetical protein
MKRAPHAQNVHVLQLSNTREATHQMVDNIRKEVCENRNISEINRAYVNKPDSKANAAIQIRATQQRQESGPR